MCTPLKGDVSPAQPLMGRRLKGTLPIYPSLLKVQDSPDVVIQKIMNKMQKKKYHDTGTRSLMPLHTGDHIVMRDYSTNQWAHKGTV